MNRNKYFQHWLLNVVIPCLTRFSSSCCSWIESSLFHGLEALHGLPLPLSSLHSLLFPLTHHSAIQTAWHFPWTLCSLWLLSAQHTISPRPQPTTNHSSALSWAGASPGPLSLTRPSLPTLCLAACTSLYPHSTSNGPLVPTSSAAPQVPQSRHCVPAPLSPQSPH